MTLGELKCPDLDFLDWWIAMISLEMVNSLRTIEFIL